METGNTIWIQIAILIIQVVIAIISYFKIYRHRVVYGIKRYSFHPPTFEPPYSAVETEKEISQVNEELVSGKYTILQMVARTECDIEVYLGQLRK